MNNTNNSNFNEANVANIRAMLKKDFDSGTLNQRVYTMLQRNSANEVVVTESSRKKSARAIIK